ncbi:MAG: HU family DNA-binding protein [Bacteroides sp.]|nr:HU family DNA-binding protein [Bacteroides sp.]
MGVKYTFKEVIDNLNSEKDKVKGHYPRIISQGSISTQDMIEELSHNSVERATELQKSITLIEDFIVRKLKEGYNVCLINFGTFSLSAESKPMQITDDTRAESIQVKGMNFRTSPKINRKLKDTTSEKK